MVSIVRPTLMVNERIARVNIQRMADKARRHQLSFRPHFKTHQSLAVADWYREAGVNACTVSSVEMAENFAAGGWRDITIAFPINPREADTINRLAGEISLNLVAVNLASLQLLATHLTNKVNIWIEVDTGYHRTGVAPDDFHAIDSLVSFAQSNKHFAFQGFLSHAGHSYKARGKEQIQQVHDAELKIILQLRQQYIARFPQLKISIGDTPSCSVCENFEGVNEIRPGNFVFYDLTQQAIGSCTMEQIAVVMACPVVAIYPERQQVIIHGGGVHFSKDFLAEADGTSHFGRVVNWVDDSWTGPVEKTFLKSLSQEHGAIVGNPEWVRDVEIGDVVGVLPVHSCLAAASVRRMMTTSGSVL